MKKIYFSLFLLMFSICSFSCGLLSRGIFSCMPRGSDSISRRSVRKDEYELSSSYKKSLTIKILPVKPDLSGKDVILTWPIKLKSAMDAISRLSREKDGDLLIISKDFERCVFSVPRQKLSLDMDGVLCTLLSDDNFKQDDQEAYRKLEDVSKRTIKQINVLLVDWIAQLIEKGVEDFIKYPVFDVNIERFNGGFDAYHLCAKPNGILYSLEEQETPHYLRSKVDQFIQVTAKQYIEKQMENE